MEAFEPTLNGYHLGMMGRKEALLWMNSGISSVLEIFCFILLATARDVQWPGFKWEVLFLCLFVFVLRKYA